MVDALAIVAATWGIVMGASPILQIRRIRRRRSSADISIAYLLVLVFGFVLWVAYGYAISNAALVVSNGVSLTIGLLTVVVVWRYRGGTT